MGYGFESLYPGASYLLDPGYNFEGYRVPTGEIGGTTSIKTSNQLSEVSKLLNQGFKATEVSVINADVFEMMPEDHLREINRLNKLVGAESSIHAPIIDPSGFTEQGWSEDNRELAERQFKEFLKRSHDLNPKGNVPVTIHASSIPGSEAIPESHPLVGEEEKGKGPVFGRMIAVDRETGQFIPLKREKRFYPRDLVKGKEGRVYNPQEELEIVNSSHWDQQLAQLVFYKERGDELLTKFYPLISGAIKSKEDIEKLTPEQRAALQNVQNARAYLDNTYLSLNSLFNQAYKYADDKGKEALKKASVDFRGEFSKYEKNPYNIGAFSDAIQNLIGSMQVITSPSPGSELGPPQKYLPVEEFAKEKASQTLSNVALEGYKKFGQTAPIVSIENPPYGSAIASGKDLKELVHRSREALAEKLVKEGKSKSEANSIAERIIGVTWDTSHINMIRKQGFDDKQIVKETKEVAPLIKHIHYNDNFGSTHTDLPPGMGSVPFKEVMEEIQKTGFKGMKIFEGGNFFQNFRRSPFPYVLEHSGSPVYDTGTGPYWNQMGGMGNYYIGHGPVNPNIHHSTYGAGFTALPAELGGEMPGGQSRLSGTPNQ
jgi:hypothetical protein